MLLRRSFLLAAAAAPRGQEGAAHSQLVDILTMHPDLLMEGGVVARLQGKDAEANTAIAYHRVAKAPGETKYRGAATQRTDRLMKAMRVSSVALLDIKEWGPEKIMYGAPPALGYYGAYTRSS